MTLHKPIRIGLLYGGKSGEHEVSLSSAASVLQNLDKTRYEIIPIGMDKSGEFYINNLDELLTEHPKSLPVMTKHSKPAGNLFGAHSFIKNLEVVFPIAHGPLYEDGCLQGFLELFDVAYVGANVLASALGMNKDMARRVVCDEEIVCARYMKVSGYDMTEAELSLFCEEALVTLGSPVIVKPCTLGSSVGIHKVKTLPEVINAVKDARRYDDCILIEAYLKAREIELSVLENVSPSMPPKVSIAGEVIVHHVDGFYSYAAKYLQSEQTELVIPAVLNDSLLARLQEKAALIFNRLNCTGMARVDFFVTEDETIYFNEVNTIPGFTPISMYPKLWEASGLPYPLLLDRLIDIAIARHHHRKNLVTHYQ